MIIRESNDRIVFITQHDHAQISGDIIAHLKSEYLEDAFREKVILAAYQHDLGWTYLDQVPLMIGNKVCSFMDYPLIPKLEAYKKGLDEVEKMDKYSGLLCSLHYRSFYNK